MAKIEPMSIQICFSRSKIKFTVEVVLSILKQYRINKIFHTNVLSLPFIHIINVTLQKQTMPYSFISFYKR